VGEKGVGLEHFQWAGRQGFLRLQLLFVANLSEAGGGSERCLYTSVGGCFMTSRETGIFA